MPKRPFIFFAVLVYSMGCLHSALANETPLMRMRVEGNLVYYSGSISVSGKYERRLDGMTLDLMGDQICFFPDTETGKLIPREPGDTRMPWFCFNNKEKARAVFGIPESKMKDSCGYTGSATVVITEYVVNRKISSVFDTAKLIEVVSKTLPQPMPCPAIPG